MSGISGRSISSSSFTGGAPRAAAGGELLRGLGRGVSTGKILLDAILGGLWGRGAGDGVVGVKALKVLTIGSSSCEAESGALMPLLANSNRHEMDSISISS